MLRCLEAPEAAAAAELAALQGDAPFWAAQGSSQLEEALAAAAAAAALPGPGAGASELEQRHSQQV